MNKLNSIILKTAFTMLPMSLLLSCSDTDVVSSNEIAAEIGDEITLSLNAPESSARTRAGLDHKLRYTAKLFSGNNSKGLEFIEMKQALADDEKATITFRVNPGTYSVSLFADYIPSGSVADESGVYPDKYYDLSFQELGNGSYKENTEVKMRPFSSQNGTIEYCNINNDNYDCFYYFDNNIEKSESKIEKNITLTRAVAKVRFISATDAPSPVTGITVSKLSYLNKFTINNETAARENPTTNLSTFKIENLSNQANKELFYFYTFARKGDSENNLLDEIKFTVNYSDNESRETSIEGGTIKARMNYITTVRGNFLSELVPDDAGDIILHLTSSPDWNDSSSWAESEKDL